jgi:hypothetical protein
LLTACCCVAKHVSRLLWRLPDPTAATYRKILLLPAVDRGLSHQMPHAQHEEWLKPPGQKFTRAARGWKKGPCKRCILSRYLVPSRGSLGSGFPNDLDAELPLRKLLSYLMSIKIFSCSRLRFLRGLGHYSNDIVPLREEGHPVVECLLLFVV